MTTTVTTAEDQPVLIALEAEEGEGITKPSTKSTRRPLSRVSIADTNLVLDSEAEEGDDILSKPPIVNDKKNEKIKTTTTKKKKRGSDQRRRRRSSARFLKLHQHLDDDDDDEDENQPPVDSQNLGELYKKAIRMNAENRINAGNSWGFRLIENMDKLLLEDDTTAASATEQKDNKKQINFTKASCTLDASVKIYSYRVDDVHLTSYKVLANLNRNDASGKDKKKAQGGHDLDDGDGNNNEANDRSQRRRTSHSGPTETLETNIANLNLNKLDSAYDIDPLFHKMSKTFDEGGAKGLLLANLGVGNNGCNIVFDSKEAEQTQAEEQKADEDETVKDGDTEGMVDITSLTVKLDSMLGGSPLGSIPLVPQLRTLRQEYAILDSEGFIDNDPRKPKSRRYATSHEEEKEAERSIHQEALERSRISQSMMDSSQAAEPIDSGSTHNDDDETSYAAPDFGGGDDDDDFAFTDFINNDSSERYSSASFQNDLSVEGGEGGGQESLTDGFADRGQQSQTAAMLDALCSGDALDGNDYEFFSQATIEKLSQGNQWAGSAHWKRTTNLKRKETQQAPAAKTSRKKKAAKKRAFLDLLSPPTNLDEILKMPKARRGGGDPTQLSKTLKTKHGKTDNLLPVDAGVGLEQLSKLFLRPNVAVRSDDAPSKGKKVGFSDNVESFGGGFNESFGGDDDEGGAGFYFGGDDEDDDGLKHNDQNEFAVAELEGIRKVEKIQVGYATVAKKVDVRRLKKELWAELESVLVQKKDPRETVEEGPTEGDAETVVDQEEEQLQEEQQQVDSPNVPEIGGSKVLSFQDTVNEMQSSESQQDVSLPFYFICLLHLANEKSLRLESRGLTDFLISQDGPDSPTSPQ